MQQTAKPLSVLLVVAVVGSLYFVYRHLGTTRHTPPLSIPDAQDVSGPSQPSEAHRIPTILAPDSGGEDMPGVLTPTRSPTRGPDAAPGEIEPGVPLPDDAEASPEGLVPIPNPFERTLSSQSRSEGSDTADP